MTRLLCWLGLHQWRPTPTFTCNPHDTGYWCRRCYRQAVSRPEGEARMKLTCVRCERQMDNILADIPARPGQQPVGGLAFQTTGHYGSSYFDPMDGTYLELSICDPCVEEAERKGYVFRRAALQEVHE